MKNLLYSILFLIFLSFSSQIFAQAEEVKSIKIVSSWDGLGKPARSDLVIEQKQGKFYAAGKKVQTGLINEILKTLELNDEKINLEDYGITQDWLNANAEKVLPSNLKNAAQNEKDVFLKSFRDIKFVEKILPKVLSGWWTDDYPSFELEIIKSDGTKIEITSKEQTIFMLPWKVVENGETFLLAAPKFSRAVAELLPAKFTNKERLSGNRLASELAEKIYREVEVKIEEIETQNKIGAELKQIKNQYTIRKTAINYISSIDVGAPTGAYQTKEYKKWSFPSWNAELHRSDLPENVIIGVSLPYKENKLVAFDLFLEKIDGIIKQTFSVSWLAKYIAENPATEFEIRFVEDRSFSKKARESFWEDLKAFGTNGLKPEILNDLNSSVFLEVSEKFPSQWSRWLILPDGRMILWQIRGNSVLKWQPTEFETRKMYGTKDWFQTKAVISPDGEIESR